MRDHSPTSLDPAITRRAALATAARLALAPALAALVPLGCSTSQRTRDDLPAASEAPPWSEHARSMGRLRPPASTARAVTALPSRATITRIGLGDARDGLLFTPAAGAASPPALVLLLHGAGGSGDRVYRFFAELAEGASAVIVAPDSRGPTWDFIRGPFGEDVDFISRALDRVAERVGFDRTRTSVAGFSDGASYALALGLANGDRFSRVAAFSPGILSVLEPVGRPALFVSHGTRDEVLPIDRCSRRIVPELRARGYDVRYQEFDGPHTVPPEIARTALAWLTAPASSTPG